MAAFRPSETFPIVGGGSLPRSCGPDEPQRGHGTGLPTSELI